MDGGGRILVNRRSPNKEFFGGLWSIVLGGHIPAGESYDEAAAREACEEAGVESKPMRIGFFRKRLPEERENVAVYVFRTDSKLKLLPDEVAYGEFMSLKEAEKKMRREEFIPETAQLLPILRDYLLNNPLH